jgi:hypothetical protein
MKNGPKLAAILFLASPLVAFAFDLEAEAAKSRALTETLQQSLQAELKAALKDGPAQAIEVCHKKAPAIAAALSQQHGLRIGRTSLKLRNPNNAPDDWERQVLERFAERHRQGEAPQRLEHYEIVESHGKKEFRYMKAIVIPQGAPCLLCHGRAIDAAVEAKLKALYPEDRARGFQEGDLRGAFTVRKPL